MEVETSQISRVGSAGRHSGTSFQGVTCTARSSWATSMSKSNSWVICLSSHYLTPNLLGIRNVHI